MLQGGMTTSPQTDPFGQIESSLGEELLQPSEEEKTGIRVGSKRIFDPDYLFDQILSYKCPRKVCTGTLTDVKYVSRQDFGMNAKAILECQKCVERGCKRPKKTAIFFNRVDEKPSLDDTAILGTMLCGRRRG